MWILRGGDGDAKGVTLRLSAGAVKTIGRAPGADFIVDAAMVSRLHCRLTAVADRLEIEDLESTNGVFVNGRRVDRAVLKDGDRLRVGRLELVVERGSDLGSAF